MTTKEIILDKVKNNRAGWFYKLSAWDFDDEVEKDIIENRMTEVYSLNMGDGNEHVLCYEFIVKDGEKIYVQIEGTYSSWGSNSWDKTYLAEPYQHCETRYRQIKE
jgi:hypothetical protein